MLESLDVEDVDARMNFVDKIHSFRETLTILDNSLLERNQILANKERLGLPLNQLYSKRTITNKIYTLSS